jgi:hypothetical protein
MRKALCFFALFFIGFGLHATIPEDITICEPEFYKKSDLPIWVIKKDFDEMGTLSKIVNGNEVIYLLSLDNSIVASAKKQVIKLGESCLFEVFDELGNPLGTIKEVGNSVNNDFFISFTLTSPNLDKLAAQQTNDGFGFFLFTLADNQKMIKAKTTSSYLDWTVKTLDEHRINQYNADLISALYIF